MRRAILAILVAVVIAGCSKSSTTPTAPAKRANIPGYVRSDDPSIPSRDAKVIAIAKAHLEKTNGKPLDAYYRLTESDDGFSVHVEFVTGYDDDGQPVLIPGGHCTLVISTDWNVVEVLPGA